MWIFNGVRLPNRTCSSEPRSGSLRQWQRHNPPCCRSVDSIRDLVLERQAANAQATNQGPKRNEGCLKVVKLQFILLVTNLLYAFPSESTSQVSLPLHQTSLLPPTRSTTSQTPQNLPAPSLHHHHHCRLQDPREQL